jgi:hypothetical protein
MLRITSIGFAMLAIMLTKTPRPNRSEHGPEAAQDIRELISAAHGAPGALCALAARAVGNGWGSWADAPATPLGRQGQLPARLNRWDQIPPEDEQFLLDSLAAPDACVRELSVRLLGRERSDEVTSGLLSRLSSADSTLRTVAAFG